MSSRSAAVCPYNKQNVKGFKLLIGELSFSMRNALIEANLIALIVHYLLVCLSHNRDYPLFTSNGFKPESVISWRYMVQAIAPQAVQKNTRFSPRLSCDFLITLGNQYLSLCAHYEPTVSG
jgi:hypothetical protein